MNEDILTFQVYRLNMKAENINDFQGGKIEEIKLNANTFSGYDSVYIVKETLKEKIALSPNEYITLYFNFIPMEDGKLFYAEHFILFPACIKVFIHSEPSQSIIVTKINELAKK